MQATRLQTSSGLLPDSMEEIALSPQRPGLAECTAASAGRSPVAGSTSWEDRTPSRSVAFRLCSDYGVEEMRAVEVARALFAPMRQSSAETDKPSPYGMHG
jgi:hypothetical protein